MTRRRLTYLIAVVLFTPCGFVVWKSEVWLPLVYRVAYIRDSNNPVWRGRCLVSRFPSCIGDKLVFYDRNSGFKVFESAEYQGTQEATAWNADGSVRVQDVGNGIDYVEQAPWLWGATDQTEPDPPAWFYNDSLFWGAK